ncbi:hypothetical protein [Desulfomonile tiedjei]|uniref:Uncharacterized protein n=1 Tax=Desulfomonile tiedjei (strain ATCC 49306 / DSM 6799 / DCB-1) TaxID=706587 RepID=I4C503_DESTA|nr:hypothetical protein [Desulfomonile tiedjei]AFM24644.1 hypothetical protein Desti_1937 [Desulfomonile tiedjei DSM 6799]
MEHQAEICANIVKIIRERSETGQLLKVDEILIELRRRDSETEDLDRKALAPLLEQVLEENPDLKAIYDRNGIPYYHSIESLSETYGRILVWKSEDPLRMIAEVVRKNSQLYPRPVCLDSFQEPPFGLTEEEIVECLNTMAHHKDYQDIVRTVTSAGTQFLYSKDHLDSDHAIALAEWSDVGQVDNP